MRSEIARFRDLLGLEDRDVDPRPARTDDSQVAPTLVQVNSEGTSNTLRVSQSSTSSEKVALFRSLFVGRDDVYARAWSSQRTGKAGWSPAVLGGVANAKSPDREYLRYTEEVVERHLAGDMHVGIYPLLHGDVCRMLASDFDGPGWALDAGAYLDVARSLGIPGLLERPRSGDGGHVWVFFAGPVSASSARRLGVHLIREAMAVRAEIDLASYDRLIPTQDLMPNGSFGNLIGNCCIERDAARPRQGSCRGRGQAKLQL